MKPSVVLILAFFFVGLSAVACKSQVLPGNLAVDGGAPVCGSTVNPCPATSFCEAKAGTCPVKPSAADQCIAKPSDCTGANAKQPECGCDHQTYANDCERKKAGVSLDHTGPCEAMCPSDLFAAIGTKCTQENQLCSDACAPCQFCNMIVCASGKWQQLEAYPDPNCTPDLAVNPCVAVGGYCEPGDFVEPTCKAGYHKNDKLSAKGICGNGICCTLNQE